MMSSSVAAANVSDLLGIVNIPYVIDTFDKLDRFRNTPELWQPFANGAQKQGIIVADITGYGPYGWATTTPVENSKMQKTSISGLPKLLSMPIPINPGDLNLLLCPGPMFPRHCRQALLPALTILLSSAISPKNSPSPNILPNSTMPRDYSCI